MVTREAATASPQPPTVGAEDASARAGEKRPPPPRFAASGSVERRALAQLLLAHEALAEGGSRCEDLLGGLQALLKAEACEAARLRSEVRSLAADLTLGKGPHLKRATKGDLASGMLDSRDLGLVEVPARPKLAWTPPGSGDGVARKASARAAEASGADAKSPSAVAGGGSFVRSSSLRSQGKPRSSTQVFFDAAQLREQLRSEIALADDDESNILKTTGICQRLVRSRFCYLIGVVLALLNAVWVAVELDMNQQDNLVASDIVFQAVEYSFCAYFLLEILVRFAAFRRCRDGFRDAWCGFDLGLVAFHVLELSVVIAVPLAVEGGAGRDGGVASFLRVARAARLLRLARFARLLHALPELMCIVKSVVAALRPLVYVVTLLVVFIYCSAVVFRLVCMDSAIGAAKFATVPAAMGTLLSEGSFHRSPDVLRAAGGENLIFGALFVIFVLVANMILMNLFIAILCQAVQSVAAVEAEEIDARFVKNRLRELWIASAPPDAAADADADADAGDALLAVGDVGAHASGDAEAPAASTPAKAPAKSPAKSAAPSASAAERSVTELELGEFLRKPEVVRGLASLGLDATILEELRPYIFDAHLQHGPMAFADFFSLCLRMRGSPADTRQLLLERAAHAANALADPGASASADDVGAADATPVEAIADAPPPAPSEDVPMAAPAPATASGEQTAART
eukprot:TRINITY_DN13041_c0_g2_i1.p1 TRINITY_DN13041_c0_g2~~TRINITY_DN13041_c0_g2_i1.p1  ORF type:complete len:691 (-),score=215.43 TRINITY_DN13041_c0_g2_i1:20-2092(-)